MDKAYRKDFHRKVDTSELVTCRVAGCDIVVCSMRELVKFICDHVRELSGDYIMVTATNEIVMACKDERFYRCQNGGAFSIPDGGPLVTFGKLHGYKNMERITGPDLMIELFKVSEDKGYRHYFYGNTKEVLDRMAERLKAEYPKLQIAGMHPSRFRNLTEEEDKATVAEINATHPDFVWFCLGAPKGCYFAADHQGIIDGVLISVGAGFDYFAGKIKRAPMWMQKHDLEWLYRLYQEPLRLFRRYFYNIPMFLLYAYVLKRKDSSKNKAKSRG